MPKKQKHLTLEDRIDIQTGISQQETFRSIKEETKPPSRYKLFHCITSILVHNGFRDKIVSQPARFFRDISCLCSITCI